MAELPERIDTVLEEGFHQGVRALGRRKGWDTTLVWCAWLKTLEGLTLRAEDKH